MPTCLRAVYSCYEPGGTIAGGHENILSAVAGFIGGGYENTNQGVYGTISGGYRSGLYNPYGTIGGGFYNILGTNGVQGGTGSTIAGGGAHLVSHGYGTIGGGYLNIVQNNYGTIAGGTGNTVEGEYGFVGGGNGNISIGEGSVLGGGAGNELFADYGVIGGGQFNSLSGTHATIGGGQGNVASGTDYGTIPGGYMNVVEADFAFAAGTYAKASHIGALVLSDDSAHSYFASTNNNEFAVRAHGGVRFQTGATPTGVKLSPGSGTWASLCDRNSKANFASVNTRTVLEKVAALPLQTWNYKDQGENIRHIGPVAQDFHAAFGVGDDDRTITTVDADGVALAAIQGLHELVKEKDATLREQQQKVDELTTRLQALEKMLLNRVSAK